MKAKFLALAALVLGLASCQTEPEGINVDANGEAAVTISVGIPDTETRAGGGDSAVGAFGNVDFSKYDVRYILEVYNLEGQFKDELAKERMVKIEKDGSKNTSFTLRLIPGRDYRFVVWADIVEEGKETDLHYVTKDLKDIQLTNFLWNLSDETRDAYTNFYDVTDFSSSSSVAITLKRPLGKLRVVTTDIKDMFNVLPEEVTVEYTSSFYSKFNAFTSQVVSDSKAVVVNPKTIKISENKYANEWDGDKVKENLTLFADYYFAANEQEPITFTLDVKDNIGMKIPQVVFNTPIPIQRNYLTTVMGPVLTDANSITVTVNDAFENGTNWNPEEDEFDVAVWDGKTLTAPKYNATDDVYEISTGSQLAYFAAAINGTLPSTLTRAEAVDYKAETMVLTGDVDLGNNAWTPIGLNADSSNKFSGVFEGNGFKITNLHVDTEDGYTAAGLFGATNGTLKNFTVENASISHVITSSNGASSNGIAVVAGSLYSTGTIEGVNVKNAVINGNRYIGGIAGYVYGNVKNCSVEDIEIVAVPNVYKNGYDNGDKVGGVAGYYCDESVFTFSGNTVKNFNIRGYRDIGGVVGSDQYGATKNCRAENGTLTIDQNTNYYGDKTPNVGLVVGRIVNGSTLDASNTSANIEVFYIGGSSIVNHALKTNTETINIEMTADATVAIGAHEAKYYFGGADTKTINIVGNDKVLTFDHNNTDWNYIRCNNEEAKWNIKNVKLTNSGKNNGPWNRHDIRFYNDVTLENATSDKAIALLADGDLTNVVISDVHPENGEAYALWITAEGQTVNLTNCQLLAHESKKTDRGIKIDNQYVDAEAKVTLNVDGLKVKSQKKAAIMVKSTAGADITLSNIDITGVAEDTSNEVWVDEDAAQYVNKVNVVGGSMIVEGQEIVPITDMETLKSELTKAGEAGAGYTVLEISADINMTGQDWTPIKVDGYHGADIVTIDGKGHTITGLNASLFAGGFAGGSGIVIKNLTIADSQMVADNTQGYGAFVNCADSMDVITLINCHLKNSSIITPNSGAAESRIGGLVGWTAGYGNQNDGPVDSYITIEGCSVTGCTLKGAGSIGAICGHAGANKATFTTIKNCTITNNKLISTENGSWRTGVVVGTANNGQCNISNITESGNTLTQASASDFKNPTGATRHYFGRFVPAGTGTLVIDGVEIEPGKTIIAEGVYKTDAENKFYQVESAKGLVYVADNGLKAGEGVKLAADIDFAGVEFAGLDTFHPENNNTFDGQGHTVSNWTYEGGAADMGFIRNWVGPIKNIKFENCHVKSNGRSAIVAAKVYGNIENVTVNNCTIEDSYWACGIIAGLYNAGSIKNCTVTNSSIKSNGGTGGIVGVINESAGERVIEGCSVSNTTINNTGAYGASYSGGALVGMFNADGATYRIKACTVSNNELLGNHVFEKYPADENVIEE